MTIFSCKNKKNQYTRYNIGLKYKHKEIVRSDVRGLKENCILYKQKKFKTIYKPQDQEGYLPLQWQAGH